MKTPSYLCLSYLDESESLSSVHQLTKIDSSSLTRNGETTPFSLWSPKTFWGRKNDFYHSEPWMVLKRSIIRRNHHKHRLIPHIKQCDSRSVCVYECAYKLTALIKTKILKWITNFCQSPIELIVPWATEYFQVWNIIVTWRLSFCRANGHYYYCVCVCVKEKKNCKINMFQRKRLWCIQLSYTNEPEHLFHFKIPANCDLMSKLGKTNLFFYFSTLHSLTEWTKNLNEDFTQFRSLFIQHSSQTTLHKLVERLISMKHWE